MIFRDSLPKVKDFFGEEALQKANVICYLSCFTCVLFGYGRRSIAAAGRSILTDMRNAGYLLRYLAGSDDPAALLMVAQHRLEQEIHEQSKKTYLILIDGTYNSTQSDNAENIITKSDTANPAKPPENRKKMHKNSGHCFVFALVLTPCGMRIPYWLPFYTKKSCDILNRKHLSQADLAAQLIATIPLPASARVFVVGDTAFDAKQIHRVCRTRKFSWVVPVNPERVLAGCESRPKVLSTSQNLKASDFSKVTYRLDEGELASMARASHSSSKSSKHGKTYWVHHRIADVQSVGKVALLFSTKKDPAQPSGVVVQKVLMSNDLNATPEELTHIFSLRWQIELFFKEMKSQLGMCQYTFPSDFNKVIAWVNVAVTAFCYLEWCRCQYRKEATGKDKAFWQQARTHRMQLHLRKLTLHADILELQARLARPNGAVDVSALLDRLCGNPAALA